MDHVVHLICASDVHGDRSFARTVLFKREHQGNPLQALQTFTPPTVGIRRRCLFRLVALRNPYFFSVDICTSTRPTNIGDCWRMVHLRPVVLARVRVGTPSLTAAIHLFQKMETGNSTHRNFSRVLHRLAET